MNIRAIAVFSCFFCTILFLWMGYQWIIEGIGLHPLIAILGAVFFYWAPIVLMHKEAQKLECELEDLLEVMERRTIRITEELMKECFTQEEKEDLNYGDSYTTK